MPNCHSIRNYFSTKIMATKILISKIQWDWAYSVLFGYICNSKTWYYCLRINKKYRKLLERKKKCWFYLVSIFLKMKRSPWLTWALIYKFHDCEIILTKRRSYLPSSSSENPSNLIGIPLERSLSLKKYVIYFENKNTKFQEPNFLSFAFYSSLGLGQSEILIIYVLLMVTKASIVTDNPDKNMAGTTNHQVSKILKSFNKQTFAFSILILIYNF